MGAMNETSQAVELLVAVDRNEPRTLGAQLEDQLRHAIRGGALGPGTGLPSTRDLALQLSVSRRVVVDAYAQLAAEGYLSLRQGARPRVSGSAIPAHAPTPVASHGAPRARFDFRPSAPDVSAFPRAAWLRSLRVAMSTMSDADLGYGDPRGVETLRRALVEYLGRARGVVADPEHIVITNGYTQGLGLVCRALAAGGATRIALEDPSNPEDRLIVARAGLTPIAIGVDDTGTRVEDLERADADAVVLTPAHQHPTGVVLSGQRRSAVLAWLRDTRSRSRTTTTRSTDMTAPRSARSRVWTPTASCMPDRPARHSHQHCESVGSSCRLPCCKPSRRKSAWPIEGPHESSNTRWQTS
jgi:GntR family transcriptional regulator/MocR family aminotransferase